MACVPITSWQIDGETMETVIDFILGGFKITADGDCSHEIKRCLLLGRKAMTNLDSILKSRDITLPSSQTYCFPSSHVWKWELDHKEDWVPKNWCFWTVVLKKTLESPLNCKEIQPAHKEIFNQHINRHIFRKSVLNNGRTDAEAEAPVLGPPDAKNWLIWKDPEAGKDWMREEKGTTEGEMVGWHHRLDRQELEQASGVGDGQGSQVCCIPQGFKESDMTEQLNWLKSKKKNVIYLLMCLTVEQNWLDMMHLFRFNR